MRKIERNTVPVTSFQSATVLSSQLHGERRRWPSLLQVGSWSTRHSGRRKKQPEPPLYPPVENVVDLPLIDIDNLFSHVLSKRSQFQKSNSRRSMASTLRQQWYQKSTSLRSLLSISQKNMSERQQSKKIDHDHEAGVHGDFPVAEIVTFSSENDSCSTLGQELLLLQTSSYDIGDDFPSTAHSQSTTPSMLEIEVVPGVFRPFIGAMETMLAIRSGNEVEVICPCCGTRLLCVCDAGYCLCPECRVISPLESHELSNECGISLGCAISSLFTRTSSSSSCWKGPSIYKEHRHKNIGEI